MFETTPDPTITALKEEKKELANKVKKLTKIIAKSHMRPLEEILVEFKSRNDALIKKLIQEIRLGLATDEDLDIAKKVIVVLEEYTYNIIAAISSENMGKIHEMRIDPKYKLLEYERHQLRKLISNDTFTESIPANKRSEVLEAISNLRTAIENCTKMDSRMFY